MDELLNYLSVTPRYICQTHDIFVRTLFVNVVMFRLEFGQSHKLNIMVANFRWFSLGTHKLCMLCNHEFLQIVLLTSACVAYFLTNS